MPKAGMILQRHDGRRIISAYRYLFNCYDAIEANIHALLIGKALACQYTQQPSCVQSNSSTALSCLSSTSLDHSVMVI